MYTEHWKSWIALKKKQVLKSNLSISTLESKPRLLFHSNNFHLGYLLQVIILWIHIMVCNTSSILKIEGITVGQAHVNTRKLTRNILTGTAVFLNQKRANVCEHTTKMVSLESL